MTDDAHRMGVAEGGNPTHCDCRRPNWLAVARDAIAEGDDPISAARRGGVGHGRKDRSVVLRIVRHAAKCEPFVQLLQSTGFDVEEERRRLAIPRRRRSRAADRRQTFDDAIANSRYRHLFRD